MCEEGGERWLDKVVMQGIVAISPEISELSSPKDGNVFSPLSYLIPGVRTDGFLCPYVSCDHSNASKTSTVFMEMQDS